MTKRRNVVSLAAKFKSLSRSEQLSTMFYLVSGVLLLVLLPFSGFAPHLALIGVFSLITGAIVLTKRGWAVWFIAVQFITVMVFAFWTIAALGASNWLATVGLAVYAVLTLVATLFLTIWCKTTEL